MTTANPDPMTDGAPAEPQASEAKVHPWADLGAEHFRLLRLAALPIDRRTGARPLRFVQLGRVERHSPQLSMLRLTIHLPDQAVRKQINTLEIWIDHRARELRFGPDKGLHLEPVNRGLGRFLVAQGVAWAQQHCAHYLVEGGALHVRDAPTDDARARRDHFLQTQGFTIDYQDPLQLKASYSAARVSILHSDWHSDKVQIVETLEAAAMLQRADQALNEQEARLRKLEERAAQYKREDGSLRFTIACLVTFCVFQAGLLIWIATH